jgi:hypothetical protein
MKRRTDQRQNAFVSSKQLKLFGARRDLRSQVEPVGQFDRPPVAGDQKGA